MSEYRSCRKRKMLQICAEEREGFASRARRGGAVSWLYLTVSVILVFLRVAWVRVRLEAGT